jgi:hypothetical protein
LMSVGSFILSVTLLYNFSWVRHGKKLLVLLAFALFSATIWLFATRQLASLILGDF